MNSVVESCALEKVAIIGNSAGAPISLLYAARHPKKVSCLVLMGGFVRGPLKRGVDPAHVSAFSQLIKDGWGKQNAAFRQLMSTQLFPHATPEQMREFDKFQRLASDGETAAALISELSDIDLMDSLGRISAPTLILHSEHDARQPFEHALEMADRIPNSELQVMDTRNHIPLVHEPAFSVCMEAVVDFVKKYSE